MKGENSKKEKYLGEWNSILTANDITFNGPVSLWNALQEKAEVFSDEQAVIADLKLKLTMLLYKERDFSMIRKWY